MPSSLSRKPHEMSQPVVRPATAEVPAVGGKGVVLSGRGLRLMFGQGLTSAWYPGDQCMSS
jgi:hypothetical protein